MFLDVLEMIFDNFAGVISAFDVTLFSVSGADISFWELLLGMFTVAIIFGFFLRPRVGSGLGGVINLLSFSAREDAAEESQSYEHYAATRSRNESYNQRYNQEHRR